MEILDSLIYSWRIKWEEVTPAESLYFLRTLVAV